MCISRKVFTEQFNIGFGYPRKDTCSTCDSMTIKLQAPNLSPEQTAPLLQEKELHLRKAQVFYDRKKQARQDGQTKATHAALVFDFSKNLSSPNITTSDVYYRRQLSLYSFIVHSLSDDKVHLHCYDETVAKKGADEVASMLLHYFQQNIAQTVTHLRLFCDSCAGQNKNWTIIRFLHYLVVHKKMFTEIKIFFPIRGHSYMECDRDMAIVNQKAKVETPSGWMEEFRKARQSPSPYNVVDADQGMFFGVTEHIKLFYRASCPMPSRPMREICFTQSHPRLVHYRTNWHGPMDTAVVSKPVGRKNTARLQPLRRLYEHQLPTTAAKFKDLQVLKQFCTTEAQDFYTNLPHEGGNGNTHSHRSTPLESDSESEYLSSD